MSFRSELSDSLANPPSHPLSVLFGWVFLIATLAVLVIVMNTGLHDTLAAMMP